MIVAHLIGGNMIEGFGDGVVIINNKQLETSYKDLAYVCGSIPLGDLDTSISLRRTEEHVQSDYIKLVRGFDDELGEDFVINNHLTKEVSFSTYEIDIENKTLTLKIETYE
ncbi:hypothetical protein B4086_5555 [Bacillus cereus]|nr:hypothetical protein B4086_5555 [Bacillus cereus]